MIWICIYRIPNNGKEVAFPFQWSSSLEHAPAMLAANQSQTTHHPASLTVKHVRQRMNKELIGKRPRICEPQTNAVENIGVATDSTLRFCWKRPPQATRTALFDRFARSNRLSLNLWLALWDKRVSMEATHA